MRSHKLHSSALKSRSPVSSHPLARSSSDVTLLCVCNMLALTRGHLSALISGLSPRWLSAGSGQSTATSAGTKWRSRGSVRWTAEESQDALGDLGQGGAQRRDHVGGAESSGSGSTINSALPLRLVFFSAKLMRLYLMQTKN